MPKRIPFVIPMPEAKGKPREHARADQRPEPPRINRPPPALVAKLHHYEPGEAG